MSQRISFQPVVILNKILEAINLDEEEKQVFLSTFISTTFYELNSRLLDLLGEDQIKAVVNPNGTVVENDITRLLTYSLEKLDSKQLSEVVLEPLLFNFLRHVNLLLTTLPTSEQIKINNILSGDDEYMKLYLSLRKQPPAQSTP